MILIDTSVWVDHLRSGLPELVSLLEEERVLMHPVVLGEIACGDLRQRQSTLRLLSGLPEAVQASNAEAIAFIEAKALMGQGIGFIDVHLLASTALSGQARLWTHDKRLAQAAMRLRLAWQATQ